MKHQTMIHNRRIKNRNVTYWHSDYGSVQRKNV